MNLADMLSYADIAQLTRIAKQYDCECEGHSKNALIQSILSTLNRRDVSERIIQNSSIEDLRFLNSILLDQRNSFSLEELIARVELSRFSKDKDEKWNPREMILKFKHRGWLFNGVSHQTKYLFQVPNDLKERFCELLAKHFMKTILVISEPPHVYRDEQQLIQEDFYNFLHFLYHQDVPLTSEGFMYKRSIHQLLSQLAVHEKLPAKGEWRFGYGRRFKEYPNRLSFIYDYCYFQEWITEQGNSLQLTSKGSQFVTEKQKVKLADLYSFWVRLYKGPIKNLHTFVFWIDKLAQQWITVHSLMQSLCHFVKPYYYDSAENIMEQRILHMLMHLGMLRIGEDHNHGKVIQMTPLGHHIVNGTHVPEDEEVEQLIESMKET